MSRRGFWHRFERGWSRKARGSIPPSFRHFKKKYIMNYRVMKESRRQDGASIFKQNVGE